MSQPPYEPERPQDRPQDRPHDPTRAFPTYGRAGESQTPGASGGGSWAAPGQPTPGAQQSPYGSSPYGSQSPYGQAAGSQVPGGQPVHGPGYAPGQYPSAYGQAPGPYGYGYGYAGYGYSSSGGTNGLATAALITGLGGFVIGVSAPVAIGLGIAALVQLRRRPQEGKGMAIAGLVMGSLVTLGYGLLIALVVALGSSSDDYSAPDPGSSNTTYVEDLIVGECFDETSQEDEVVRQPCTDAHDAEVVAIPAIPGTAYPGDSAINKAADRACAPAFGTYVGKPRDQSELYLDWWTPSKEAWEDGDHRVLCAAYGPDDDKLTESVKNSHR